MYHNATFRTKFDAGVEKLKTEFAAVILGDWLWPENLRVPTGYFQLPVGARVETTDSRWNGQRFTPLSRDSFIFPFVLLADVVIRRV